MKTSRRKTYSSATSVSQSRRRRRGRRSPDSQENVSSSETQTSGTSKTTTTSREHNYNSSTDVPDSNDDEYDDEEEEDDDESGTGNQSSSPAPLQKSSRRTSPAIGDDKGRVYVPANTAYVNVAPLPVFHGRSDECPVAHLARFAQVCRANNAAAPDAMARIFSVTLEDEAALWYELEVESRPAATWEEKKEAFLLAFRRPDYAERLRTELVTMAQSDGESVYGYYLRMQWILKRWQGHGLPALMLKGIFLDGLRDDFRDWIIPQRPNTLEEALRMAMVWEQAEAMKMARRRRIEEELSSSSLAAAAKMRNIVLKSCGFCGGDEHEECGCEVKKKLRELWLATARLKSSFNDDNVNGTAMANSVKKDCRSLSLTTNIMRRQGEGEGEGLLMGSNDRMSLASQCQCCKHQCWKKKTNSFVITDSNL